VAIDLESPYQRIITARQSLLDLRTARANELHRLRAYLKAGFAKFMNTTDPISGARLADVQVEGSKQHGDLIVALAFFEGTKLSLGVDRLARYFIEAKPAHVLPALALLTDLRIAADDSRVELVLQNADGADTRTVDIMELVAPLIAYAVASLEEEAKGGAVPAADALTSSSASVIATAAAEAKAAAA